VAWAALGPNSVGSRALKPNSVKASELAPGAVKYRVVESAEKAQPGVACGALCPEPEPGVTGIEVEARCGEGRATGGGVDLSWTPAGWSSHIAVSEPLPGNRGWRAVLVFEYPAQTGAPSVIAPPGTVTAVCAS
jgi:hypothetical protein